MQAETTKVQDGRADFDFLIGTWVGQNRRLRERLKGSTSWEEFEGVAVARHILGGLGNIDEVTFNRESGPAMGFTLRLFDVTTKEWRIYWADGSHGEAGIPVVGKFVDRRGEFYSQEPFNGQTIFCRFIWTVLSETSATWEQAFSVDGGKTWETNWTMKLTKTGNRPSQL
jgi:hypothetical protein